MNDWNSYNTWTFVINCFIAIGTVGATSIALSQVIKENWRFFWLKIYSASIGPITYNHNNKKCNEKRTLVLGIKNKKDFDIGLQLAHVFVYKNKVKLFSKRDKVKICFGNRARHPDLLAIKKESNEYFLSYDDKVIGLNAFELRDKGIPNNNDIYKITVELWTTVGRYYYTIPKKNWHDIIDSLSNYSFPLPDSYVE